ncbi:hypothetical protein MEJ65_00475 [Candidatus Carsonella ruddii]|uniref:tyrosine--tRNA ligase n=1 Tax=Carsonella ruddii TaxID=114186 RepID=A0AAJ6K0Z4_CARRU|nr:hypothetical protein [Candidatus Carsonella ruddii]WGS66945.1 hypothetical protein MEJ62_00470 [Candidatus Carsonella ruddii]WGS67136.1 hypothetical protein MEJ60_00470 [Candidatus Carsonella ruddii]WGS67328.1 hypothetical protein MEJ65_00475 [Candidatus Carsonella ruddii]WMC18347.1 MAG: hypothetical protein NU472_00480 [Candidatus Carsonella ruddii]WMC18541.1 MAG: hypothetical protein NU470_00480 [Candidatus Carsonella ruddii]
MNFFYSIFKKIIGKYNFFLKKIKFGIDPTYFSIHIGHLMLINFIFFLIKKKFFIIIVIGDFTASIKKCIEKKNLIINSICLKSQFINIIGDLFIYFNSIWINKKKLLFFLKIFDILKINKYINNNLKIKINNNKLEINNLIYPIFQAYDSLIINSDIEIGGIDQLLNVICGRFLQKIFKKNKQNSILLIILEKKKKKISKSNNSVFINTNIKDLFLFKSIFFNLKNYIINFKKNNIFFLNNVFFFNYKKKIYFKQKNFFSFYYKKIFNINKFFFNKLLYKKNIFLNKKILIKNFFLKKNFYFFQNINIFIYDK